MIAFGQGLFVKTALYAVDAVKPVTFNVEVDPVAVDQLGDAEE